MRTQASYALGYNLAIEYLADYEKTWMLDSFRALDDAVFSAQGRNIDWLFLEVHAEGESAGLLGVLTCDSVQATRCVL